MSELVMYMIVRLEEELGSIENLNPEAVKYCNELKLTKGDVLGVRRPFKRKRS